MLKFSNAAGSHGEKSCIYCNITLTKYTSSSERSQVCSTNTEFFIPFTKDKRISGDCSHAHGLGVTHDGSELHHVAVLSSERSKN